MSLRNTAMRDYQESVTSGQTDGWARQTPDKVILCAALLRRRHNNKRQMWATIAQMSKNSTLILSETKIDYHICEYNYEYIHCIGRMYKITL